MRIRPFESQDLDEAVDVWFTSWAATFPSLAHPWPRARWREHFEAKLTKGACVSIAEDQGRIVGFLLLFEEIGRLDQIFI
ncbi:MAG: GNAT family N-acetyltransferase, partial [Polyangiaceae bacterium]